MAKAEQDAPKKAKWRPEPHIELFLVAFTALFLELMLIRWAPAAIQLVAYYANLMLISSFLGLGLGAMASSRKLNLFRLFPLLLLVETGFVALCGFVILPSGADEHRFNASAASLLGYSVLVGIFVLNTALFVPLGERIGNLFHRLPPLNAYKWDLGGSLCGTLCFGIFSFLAFSPTIGMIIVVLLYLLITPPKRRIQATILSIVAVVLVAIVFPRNAIWSPYHFLTIHRYDDVHQTPIRDPDPNIRTMDNPPFHFVKVNQHFYQPHGTIDPKRFTKGSAANSTRNAFAPEHQLPFHLHPKAERVAVVGSGGGLDVEAAILADVKEITAVEIDPKLIEIAKRFNPSGVYENPRVNLKIDDARAFFAWGQPGYDLIIFGFLDSQALFSSMSNVRLDGFVHTVESIEAAYELLDDDGMITLAFVSSKPWLTDKLFGMARKAVGRDPVMYGKDAAIVLAIPKNPSTKLPNRFGEWKRILHSYQGTPLATDNWPYLYLSRPVIPTDYLVVISAMVLVSLGAIFLFRPKGANLSELHFMALGVAFLLLETKSITRCSLYFGSTWLVSMLVIAGILVMVILSNLVAQKLKKPRNVYYAPLFLILVSLFAVPTEFVLGMPFWTRMLWTMFAVPLPIFFAGLIFSTSLRESKNPSASFGSNLIGATLGGFLEYLGMLTGHQFLYLIVMGAYVASFLARPKQN